MSGSRNIWGDLPADPRALRLSVEELDRVDGLCFHEVENEVDYLECVALVLHEVKRLRWRPIATAPMDGTHILVGRAGAKPIRAWFEKGRWWMHGAGPHSRNVGDLTGPYAPTHWMSLPPAPGGEAAQAAETGTGSVEDEYPVAEGQAPDLKALQAEKDRLRAECDVLMAQASACAEEVDRVRVEIGNVQAENARLTTALAESERKRVEAEAGAEKLRDVLLRAKQAAHAPWTGYTTHPVPIDSEEILNLRNCVSIIALGLATTPPRRPPMSMADETIPAAWSDVLAERRRQVAEEWWTPQHDDKHVNGEMAMAAASYACAASWDDEDREALKNGRFGSNGLRGMWPWSRDWWKPTDRRRDLVKAGALILAEIERLDRAALIAREEAGHGR